MLYFMYRCLSHTHQCTVLLYSCFRSKGNTGIERQLHDKTNSQTCQFMCRCSQELIALPLTWTLTKTGRKTFSNWIQNVQIILTLEIKKVITSCASTKGHSRQEARTDNINDTVVPQWTWYLPKHHLQQQSALWLIFCYLLIIIEYNFRCNTLTSKTRTGLSKYRFHIIRIKSVIQQEEKSEASTTNSYRICVPAPLKLTN